MSRTLSRILIGLVSVVLVLCIVAGLLGFVTVRRSFPKVDGQVHLQGLNGPVDIYRDTYGIPQIYASTPHDLYFAEGYTHAQDRFWQMDFWRHIGSGRLSEMFGTGRVGTDTFLRTMGWARIAQQEVDNLDENTRANLQAYTDGVNAYLADHKGSAVSLEYAILKLLTPNYQIEPWQIVNTLTWGKAMAWDLRGNIDEEIQRAMLLKTLTPEQVNELFPAYPADHPVIVPDFAIGSQPPAPSGWQALAAYAPGLETVSKQIAGLDAILGPAGSGIGSNSWTISGKRTATGKPLLANDPHLSSQMPSIWYEIGLHCITKSAACPLDVTGFSFAGVPGVVIGHNDRIAWGFTNLGPDVMDLYIEKINPQNPNQYEVNGQWQDMQLVKETIQTGSGEPVDITVRYTRHGPVISDTNYLPENFSQQSGVQLPAPYAVSLRWTALEPTELFRAILGFDAAQNWDEFRNAAQYFVVPAQNLVYADVDGNIGYQTPGRIPIRAQGDGRLPVPGWTDNYEWQGYLPFDQLPTTFNPPQGYIVTANNAAVGTQYPHLITTDWDYGFRAERIVDLIEHAPGPVDSAYIQKMQGDDLDLNAEKLVPVLLQVPLEDSHLESTRNILQGWDFQDQMDSAPAALFAVFWRHLLAGTFHDELPQDYWPDGGSTWFEVVRHLVDQPASPWWDNKTTPAVENRDQIFRQAFGEAVAELEQAHGKNPQGWKWGDLHTLTFQNQSLGESGVAPIEALFNRGPFRTSGGKNIVNATGWDATAEQPYSVNWLPSMRMIVDLSNLSSSLSINTTGQSGHAYNAHYVDLADMWRNIQYHPMLWDQAQIEEASKAHLQLAP